MEKDLNSYMESRKEYLESIGILLSKKPPKDDSEKIKEHLIEVIGERATLTTIIAKLEKFLDDALFYYLTTKEKGETDFDRKYKLDAKISNFRYWRNLVEGLIKTIDIQASAMQSLLSFEKKYLTQMGHIT